MSQAIASLADAEASIRSGEWDQALELLQGAKSSEPSEAEVYEKLAHVLAVRGKFKSVLATNLELIELLISQEDFERAESVVGRVLALSPDSEPARSFRIDIAKKSGDSDRAVALSRELARLCIENGDGERSINLLRDAQAEQPGNLDISLELAEMFVSHGHIQDGANQYRKVANAFQEAGNISKAAEAYRRMKVVQSDDPDVLLTLGRLYTELGQLDEAEQEFRSVLRHDLEHEDALMELGLVCQLKGGFRSGILAFNKVLQKNPGLARAMRKLGELNHSMGNMTESVKHFLEAAQSFLEADEREQAVELFQIVLGIDEGNAAAQQGLTNLGAPLEAIEFQPPLPPSPPEEEEEEPEPVAERQSSQGGTKSSGDSIDEAPIPKAEKKSPSTPSGPAGGAGKKRRGLVAGSRKLKHGLVDPSLSTGKPMMGGKPTLSEARGGLIRRGLGAKTLGGEKPMLGGRKPALGARRSKKSLPQEESVFEEVSEVESSYEEVADSSDEFADLSSDLFEDDSQEQSESSQGHSSSLFDVEDSLFSPDSDSDAQSEALTDSLFDPEPAQSLAIGMAVGDESKEPDGDLFDFDSDSGGDLFSEAESSGGDLFGSLDGGEASEGPAVPSLFDPAPTTADGSAGLFDDDGDPFENLFSEDDNEDSLESGTMAGETVSSISGLAIGAGIAGASAPGEDELGLDALFDPEPTADESPLPAGDDLFSEDFPESEPSTTSDRETDGGLFSEVEDVSADLFGSVEEGDDLFGGQFSSGGLFDDEPAPAKEPVSSLSLETGEDLDALPANDSLFGEPTSDAPEKDDLFGDFGSSDPVGDPGGGLFGDDSDSVSSLFDDPGDGSDDLFGASSEVELEHVGSESTELKASESVETESKAESLSDDLFGGFGEPESTFGQASDSAGDLFGDGEDLFGESGENLDRAEQPDVSTSSIEAESPVNPSAEKGMESHGLFGDSDSLFSSDEAPLTADEPTSDGLFDDMSATDELFSSSDGGELFASDSSPDDLFEASTTDDLFGSDSESSDSGAAVKVDDQSTQLDLSSGESLFAETGGMGDGQFSSLDEPEDISFELPMPGDAPLTIEVAEQEPVPSPEVLVSADAESENDDLTLEQMRAEEMAKTVTDLEEEPGDLPEFMALLEATLPPTEVAEPPAPEEEEDIFASFDSESEELSLDETGELDFQDEREPSFEDIQVEEPEPEPEPEPTGPVILGKPVVSLSFEEESSKSDILEADELRASLGESDVATQIAAYRKALEQSADNLVLRTRLADIHLKYGLLEDAVVQYRQVMKRNPESIPVLHRVIQAEFWNENYVEAAGSLLALAQLHLKRNEKHDAIDTLQTVLSLDPLHFEARKVLVSVFASLDESKLAAHHLRQLAETALTKGDVDEAIAAFQQLLELSGDSVFEERLAQIYEVQGDVEKALEAFQSLVGRYRAEERWEEAARVTERIVELNPELLEDRAALIDLYKKLGNQDRAIAQQFKLAKLYQNNRDLGPCIELYEEVLRHQPENFEARRLLVDAYLDCGNVASALEQAESLTEHYLTTKDHSTAISLYSRLVEADSENVELQERLVKFYGLAGDPENAKVRWVQLADLHERNERYEKAAEAIRKALEIDESQVDLVHRLAVLFADRIGDGQSALVQLRKLFAMAPDRLDAVSTYVELLLREEQVSEAGEVLKQLESAGGDSVAIKTSVISTLKSRVEKNPSDLKARFNYGELCYHLLDLDHAIEQFQQTRRHADFELMSYNMLGLCFAKKSGFNMLDLAIKQFKKGLEIKGHEDQAYLGLRYNLAMLLYQNGKVSEALTELKACYTVDIAYRDVRSWIERIESELSGSGA